MDPLSDVLRVVAAHSHLSTGLVTGGDWALSIPGFNGLKFCSLVRGRAWLRLVGENLWYRIETGDSLILTKGRDFVLASDRRLEPVAAEVALVEADDTFMHYGDQAEVIFHVGKMVLDQAAASFLIDALPAVIYVPAGSREATSIGWLLERLSQEICNPQPGWNTIRDSLVHMMFIEGIRSWSNSPDSQGVGWCGALRDPRMIRALIAMHQEPAKPWQLTELAEVSNMSRAGFAGQFRKLTGITPFDYLTRWRLQLASRHLLGGGEPVALVGSAVGYTSESAFSTAFKRLYGLPPSDYRKKYTGMVQADITRQH